jgi:hypothetical protein
MAYIGNEPGVGTFIVSTERFNGTGSCTQFTITQTGIDDANAIDVIVNSVIQDPTNSYSITDGVITFTEAPSSGTDNIIVRYRATTVITFSSITTSQILDGQITASKIASGVLPSAAANSAGVYANSAFATANTGTASGSYANSAFATANTGTAAGSYANSAFSVANNGVGIDATQNTNITSAGAYANAAFATANTGSASGSYANSAFATANTASTNATNAGTYANSAFTKANTAGAGTVTSVATGNGLSGGTITSTGTLVVACPTHNSIGSYCVGGTVVSGTSGSFAFGTNYSAGSGNGQIQVVSRRVYNDPCTGPATREPVYANSLSGSWKCMGAGVSFTSGNGATSLFCRVS